LRGVSSIPGISSVLPVDISSTITSKEAGWGGTCWFCFEDVCGTWLWSVQSVWFEADVAAAAFQSR